MIAGTRSIITVVAMVATAGVAWAQRPDFSGRWVLNEGMSQEPFEKIDTALGTSQLKGAGTAQYNAYNRATLLKDTDRVAFRDALFEFVEVLGYTEIDQNDEEIQISVGEGDNFFALFYLDGEKHARQLQAGDRIEATATWDGDLLRIVQEIDGGAVLTETYSMPSEDQLAVIYQMETKHAKSPIMFRVVYDREDD